MMECDHRFVLAFAVTNAKSTKIAYADSVLFYLICNNCLHNSFTVLKTARFSTIYHIFNTYRHVC